MDNKKEVMTTNSDLTDNNGVEKEKMHKGKVVKKLLKIILGVILGLIMLVIIGVLIFEIVLMVSPDSVSTTPTYSTAVDLDKDQIDIIDQYILAVNEAKGRNNYSLDVETSSEIKDLQCSISLFQSIINSVINSMDTNFSSTESYNFKSSDESSSPMSVIQPSDILIDDSSYGGLSSVESVKNGDLNDISFTVAAETIEFSEIMSMMGTEDLTPEERIAMRDENMENMDEDFSVDEIKEMEEYQAFINMVPNHSQYFDMLSALSSIMSSFTFDEEMEENDENSFGFFGASDDTEMAAPFSDEDEGMVGLDNGTVTFGDMTISATLADGDLQSVSIILPITIDISAVLMNNDVEISYTIELNQNYTFIY